MQRAWASIDLVALQRNLSIAKQAAPQSKLLAVIKADGYGHGLCQVAEALQAADGFGVACLQEAIKLREAGIQKTILLLEGVFSPEELKWVERYKLSMVVHQVQQLEWLEQLADSRDCLISTWLKLDTGMHRLGFSAAQFVEAEARLKSCAAVDGDITVMSHFANADLPTHPANQQQLSLLNAISKTSPKSMANSAALLALPQSHFDWVRPGIMLFGCSPFAEWPAEGCELHPVMTLKARLFEIKSLKKGDAIGYGGGWVSPEDMKVGVVSIGYGDGYPRHAANGTPVWINGYECSLAGRVSMDMICVDLRNYPDAQCGDEAVLWGAGLAIERVAAAAGTIGYELLCGITPRVKLEYLRVSDGQG